VDEFAVCVLKSPSRNVIAFRIAPSRVPVRKSENKPGGALESMVAVPLCVPVEEVITTLSVPTGVLGLTTALICVGEV